MSMVNSNVRGWPEEKIVRRVHVVNKGLRTTASASPFPMFFSLPPEFSVQHGVLPPPEIHTSYAGILVSDTLGQS